MTLRPRTFLQKCPGMLKGHVPDMSCVPKYVLKFSRGRDGPLPTKDGTTFLSWPCIRTTEWMAVVGWQWALILGAY